MGQSEVFNIIRNNNNILKKDIEKIYKKVYGQLGTSSINASLARLSKTNFIKRTLEGKIYRYSIIK